MVQSFAGQMPFLLPYTQPTAAKKMYIYQYNKITRHEHSRILQVRTLDTLKWQELEQQLVNKWSSIEE